MIFGQIMYTVNNVEILSCQDLIGGKSVYMENDRAKMWIFAQGTDPATGLRNRFEAEESFLDSYASE